MQYWLMKSEPDAYGWDKLVARDAAVGWRAQLDGAGTT